MGRGIALQVKNAFPDNFKAYQRACRHQEVVPGRMFVFETGTMTNPRFIINFPTKRHWRGKSRLGDIELGLQALAHFIRDQGISSVAIPPLGSGLGGLNWNDVRPRIQAALSDLEGVEVLVYEPTSTPENIPVARSVDIPKMTSGRAALVVLMYRYLGGLLDPFVSLLEVHKLMYFMQESGQPLKLRYAKGPFGPYAENLRHVLHAVEGYFVSGYADGGDNPQKQLELVPGAMQEASLFLEGDLGTKDRFDRVGDLVEGFETPFGLELLSTVHWVASQEKADSIEEVIAAVYGWGERKQRFSPRQIGLAFSVLQSKGWLPEKSTS
jgi:hypothetical protein